MAIHWLNACIGFISPLDELDEEESQSNTNFDESLSSFTTDSLSVAGAGSKTKPTTIVSVNSNINNDDNDEFKPFQRKVNELFLWQTFFWTLLICNLLTFNSDLDIPVYWPLLKIKPS